MTLSILEQGIVGSVLDASQIELNMHLKGLRKTKGRERLRHAQQMRLILGRLTRHFSEYDQGEGLQRFRTLSSLRDCFVNNNPETLSPGQINAWEKAMVIAFGQTKKWRQVDAILAAADLELLPPGGSECAK